MQANLKRIVVILLVLANLSTALEYWRSTIDMDRDAGAISEWEARMAEVREDLPIQRGIIGFVGEWDVPGITYAYWDQEGEYILSQYALAPLILKRGPVAEWNVAVLSPQAVTAWQNAYGKQFEIVHVERNVYILHRIRNQ